MYLSIQVLVFAPLILRRKNLVHRVSALVSFEMVVEKNLVTRLYRMVARTSSSSLLQTTTICPPRVRKGRDDFFMVYSWFKRIARLCDLNFLLIPNPLNKKQKLELAHLRGIHAKKQLKVGKPKKTTLNWLTSRRDSRVQFNCIKRFKTIRNMKAIHADTCVNNHQVTQIAMPINVINQWKRKCNI